jgi:hypothetical protein
MQLLGPRVNLFATRNKWGGPESMNLIFDCQGESGQGGPDQTHLDYRLVITEKLHFSILRLGDYYLGCFMALLAQAKDRTTAKDIGFKLD